MSDKNWIEHAVKHPGALSARAKAAGQTLAQYMATPHKSEAIKKEVNLAHILQSLPRHHKGK